MDKEQVLKKQILKSAEAVKKKIKVMRDIKTNNDIMMETVFKPITKPLKQIANIKKYASEKDVSSPPTTIDRKMVIKRKNSLTPTRTIKKLKFSPSDSQEEHGSDVESDNEDDYNAADNMSENNPSMVENNESDSQSDKDIENNYSHDSSGSYFGTPVNRTPRTSWSMSSETFDDIPFGVRREGGFFLMGTSHVSVNDNNIIVAKRTYLKTEGLMELLFKKSPNLNIITTADKQNYKTMLLDTNAHRRNYDASKPIKSNKGMKYTQIIKPLFIKLTKNELRTENLPRGSGVPFMKKVKPNLDYVYWDNPNELVDRLKLLWASRDAGNTGLDNEIISIVEELRECGIVS